MQEKACSFTGHRKIEPQHEMPLRQLLSRAIEYLYNEGVRTFYSGGAVGFDIMAAREVIRYRMSHPDVSLVMLLPCTNQDSLWSERQRDGYEFVLAAANEVVYLEDGYTDGCMMRRNRELVRRSDYIVAYLLREGSGAGQTVRMAERAGKRVFNLVTGLKDTKTL